MVGRRAGRGLEWLEAVGLPWLEPGLARLDTISSASRRMSEMRRCCSPCMVVVSIWFRPNTQTQTKGREGVLFTCGIRVRAPPLLKKGESRGGPWLRFVAPQGPAILSPEPTLSRLRRETPPLSLARVCARLLLIIKAPRQNRNPAGCPDMGPASMPSKNRCWWLSGSIK